VNAALVERLETQDKQIAKLMAEVAEMKKNK
jgi:hypothetical protein